VYFSASTDLQEFAIGCLVAGVLTIFLLSAAESATPSQPSKLTKWGFITVMPFVILCIYSGPSLLYGVFQGLGIRAKQVSIELPEAEAGAVERIADIIQRPLLDCRRAQSGKVLVHSANVLWTGVGEQTLIRFDSDGDGKRALFAPRSTKTPYGRLKIETKTIQIIKTVPPIDPCFDLPGDLLFDAGKYTLQVDAKDRIKELVESIKKIGKPSKILVRGHSDPRRIVYLADGSKIDNQLLSEKRATTIANALRDYLKDPKLHILSEGAGSREPKAKCANDKATSAYEQDQCNKPNRRVEIRITYQQ
jgi:outer membrane protein OmpA-like peptidoglycan-associated protein